MKKLLTLILALSLVCLLFTACNLLMPGGNNDNTDPCADGHDFVLFTKGKPECLKASTDYYKCSDCGKMETRTGDPATGHNYEHDETILPTCTGPGYEKDKCANCGHIKTTPTPAIGHNYSEKPIEASRLVPCLNEGCSVGLLQEGNGKYAEVLVYKFNDDDKAKIEAIHEEIGTLLDACEAYDPALHTYVEDSDLHKAYLAFEERYEAYYKLVEYVVTQYQIAQIEYHMDMESEEKEATFQAISEYRTALVADFYTYSQPIYDSLYRDYYYYGMTEDEIKEFLFDSSAVSNPEYVALNDANTAIEIEFNNIADPARSNDVPVLYEQFVSNNKKIAELLGYDTYLDFAYENMYDRDYTYEDVELISGYVKNNLSLPYNALYGKYMDLMSSSSLTQESIDDFYSQVLESFFENTQSNTLLNDYIDLLAFNKGKDNEISFSDEFNGLMSNGNLFRGEYEGAYVTFLAGLDEPIPVAYFGPGYDTPSTVVHEFGHYMNEIYNKEQHSQSYDLLEMHSQGNEMLYLAFLKDKLGEGGYELYKTYSTLVMVDTVIAALAVDTFERAVYTDTYTGPNADTIMADGKISADEYDLLYKSILQDFGVASVQSAEYWRYMTILSPCYYVSYSVSALSVLQLYSLAEDESFDAAADAYLKLFTYIDEDPEMTTEEVLEYAGLYSFTDEELYKILADQIAG